jgi:hypothetical protein
MSVLRSGAARMHGGRRDKRRTQEAYCSHDPAMYQPSPSSSRINTFLAPTTCCNTTAVQHLTLYVLQSHANDTHPEPSHCRTASQSPCPMARLGERDGGMNNMAPSLPATAAAASPCARRSSWDRTCQTSPNPGCCVQAPWPCRRREPLCRRRRTPASTPAAAHWTPGREKLHSTASAASSADPAPHGTQELSSAASELHVKRESSMAAEASPNQVMGTLP